jgi:hypothetical protein
MDRPLPWLRYVDAGDLDDDRIDFDGMNVESPTGEHLGDVDGFIVDAADGRPYYVVVDSGGWFKSKDFLLPAGYARLDPNAEAIVTAIDRSRIDRFPGFDKNEFEKLSKDDLDRYAAGFRDVAYSTSTVEVYASPWEAPEYQRPDWWRERNDPADREVDPSPHYAGRAQPGDVLGVETGGEQTHVGDTADDENLRRRDAERAARRRD